MQVKEITTKECYAVSPDTNLVQVAQAMKRHNVGALPVVMNERLLGIITDRDICIEGVAAGADTHQCKVRDFMTAEPITISPEASLEEAVDLMAKHQVRRLAVCTDGRFLGLISLGDLAVNITDDNLVAALIRKVSQPVRSEVPIGARAEGSVH